MTIITLNNKLFSMSLYLSGSIVNFLNKYWHLCVHWMLHFPLFEQNKTKKRSKREKYKTELCTHTAGCIPMLILMWFKYILCCVVCRRFILNCVCFFAWDGRKTSFFRCTLSKETQSKLIYLYTTQRTTSEEAHL